MRNFETGATRNNDEGKYDFEAFYSPAVLERFAEYMQKHRVQADGSLRAGDNWQKGMPLDAYMKSGWRHFFSWWKSHRGGKTEEDIEESICALIFNAQGYLFELLKTKYDKRSDDFRGGLYESRRITLRPEDTYTVSNASNEYLRGRTIIRGEASESASETFLDGKCDKCGGRISNQYNGPSLDFSYVWDSHSVPGQLRNSRHLYNHINNQVICLEENI